MSVFDGTRDGVKAEGNGAKEDLWKDSTKAARSLTSVQKI
jgi:hypothetical protein